MLASIAVRSASRCAIRCRDAAGAVRRRSASTSGCSARRSYSLFPVQDTGLMIGSIQGDQSISFQAMKKKLAQLQEIVQDDPAVGDRGRRDGRTAGQFRLRLHLVEAVRGAQDHGRRRRRAAARQARASGGRAAVPGRGVGSAHRRAAEQRDLSIYAALRRHRRTLQMGAAADARRC